MFSILKQNPVWIGKVLVAQFNGGQPHDFIGIFDTYLLTIRSYRTTGIDQFYGNSV